MIRVLIFCSLFLHISCTKEKERIIEYHSNGEPKLIEIVDKDLDLLCTKEFYSNKIIKRMECSATENGAYAISERTYFKNGNLKSEGSYIDNLKQGLHVSYYSNEQKHEVKNFLNDTLNGFQYNYRKNSSLRAINYFNKGELIYKRIENKDSLQFESLYPIIKAKIDSIGQKLTSVNFHIPKDLIEVNSSYNISYDVKKLPSEGGIAPYPERKLSIARGTSRCGT